MFKPNEREEVKVATIGTPHAYQLEDPDCYLEVGRDSKFSKQVKIWMINQSGQLSQQIFDLSNVSRIGLASAAVSEALYSEQDIDERQFVFNAEHNYISQFKDKRALHAIKQEYQKGTLKKISFCRAQGGYRPDSIENAALAAFVAIHETHKAHNQLRLKSNEKLAPIKLLVHPKLFAKESEYVKKYYVDNAFWANLGAFQLIAVIPHSQEWEVDNKLKFWETPGVFSHEYGHHIFHTHGPSVESPSRKFLYHRQFFRINNGFNEGFADLISYYSLSARRQLNPALLLSGETHGHQNRDVNTPNLEYDLKNFQLSIPKKYDTRVAQILGSTHTYELNSTDFEEFIIQECHEGGAIMAYVFNKLLDGYGYKDNPLKKMELLIAWLQQQEKSMRTKGNYTSPQRHLETALNGMLEVSGYFENGHEGYQLTEEQNDLLFELFPHYYSAWTRLAG